VTVELNFEKKFTPRMAWLLFIVVSESKSVSGQNGGHFLFRRRPCDCKGDRDCSTEKKRNIQNKIKKQKENRNSN